MSETKSPVVLPPPQPMKAIKLSDMPRYTQRTNDQILPEQLEPMANEIIRLSMQGTSFASMAGRLGLLPDELRQLMITYPDMQRAMAYGQGLGSDEMTGVVFERGRAGDMTAALAWLKAKGGWEPPKPAAGGSVSVKSGDTTVSIDLDGLRDMAIEQSNLGRLLE